MLRLYSIPRYRNEMWRGLKLKSSLHYKGLAPAPASSALVGARERRYTLRWQASLEFSGLSGKANTEVPLSRIII